MSEHKVTVTVELADGTTVSNTARFSSGNPLWHAYEFAQAEKLAAAQVARGITAMYGERREDRQQAPGQAVTKHTQEEE